MLISKEFQHITQDSKVVLSSEIDEAMLNRIGELRIYISILFSLQRDPNSDKVFEN